MYGLRSLGGTFGRGFGWYGLGFSYYDLLSQANLQNCSSLDTACVSANQQKEAAVEDLWVNNYESNPNTAGAPAPAITVTPNVSPAVVGTPTSLFEQNAPANEALTTIGGQTYTTPQLESGPVVFTSAPEGAVPPAAAPPPAAKPPSAPSAPKQQAQGAPVLSPTLNVPQDMTGAFPFSFGSIPWWGWAAAAGIAFFAFGGHRR